MEWFDIKSSKITDKYKCYGHMDCALSFDPLAECKWIANRAILPSCLMLALLNENNMSVKNIRNLSFWTDLYNKDSNKTRPSKIIEATNDEVYHVLDSILNESYTYEDINIASYRVETVSTSVTFDTNNDTTVHLICECGLRENYTIMLSAEVRSSKKVLCNVNFEIEDITDIVNCLKYLIR